MKKEITMPMNSRPGPAQRDVGKKFLGTVNSLWVCLLILITNNLE